MSFICTDQGCISTNAEIGSEEWKEELRQQGICEEDIEKINIVIQKIRSK